MEGLEGEIVYYKFQQDNALIYKNKLTTAFFEDSDINLKQWPGQSLTLILNICGKSLNDILDNRTN